jgi:hypothetical protein
MLTRTADRPHTHHTGFAVGTTDVRFGIIVPSGAASVPDWSAGPQIPVLVGAGLIVTQILLTQGPRQITYRLLLDSVVDAQALAGLVTQTGTLTLVAGMHSEPVLSAQQEWVHGREYEHVEDVTLLLLANRVVFAVSGRVEVDATFQAD